MDNIKFVSALKVESEKPPDNYKELCSNIFYYYDVFKGIFAPINMSLKYKNEHKLIGVSPHNNRMFYLWHSFLVLPVFFYRDMLFSIDATCNLRLLKNNHKIKELQFSIDEVFGLGDRSGRKVARILSERNPDYSYIINNFPKLKKEILGAFHYIINSACALPHKGNLEEEIKDKIENNII